MTAAADILDPRTTLARPDLAEQALEGVVRAATYRATRAMCCTAPVADVNGETGARIDQLVFGEIFDVLDADGDRLWGRARRDGVVGWVRRSDLTEGAVLPKVRVASVDAALPLNALVIEGEDPSFQPVGAFEADPVAVAERLIGVPHVPGGRSSRGTDCAGLVQQALYACGRAAPRYPDQQVQLGTEVARADARRGDLVIWLHDDLGPWNGHSALMLDADRVLHATGHHGAVVIEGLAEAEARYAADGFKAAVFRRL